MDDMLANGPSATPHDTAGEGGIFAGAPGGSARHGEDQPAMTNQDPARPGGRGSGIAVTAWAVAFLLFVAFFFYALGLGGR